MKRFFLVIFLVLLCLPFALGAFEKSFASRGLEDFVVEGVNETKCFNVLFLKQEETGYFPILSLQADFFPVKEGNALISIELNGEKIEELNPKDFCYGECFARIMLEFDKLMEENDLNICLSTGNTINKVVLSNNSLLGFYLTPVFFEWDFSKQASKTELYLGETIEVKILIHNSGSASALLDLNFVKPRVEEKLGYIEVIGETYFSFELTPGESREFIHYVKPKKAIEMSLPRAIISYKNVFGETEQVYSNIVYLTVKEIEEKLVGNILSEENVFKPGEKTKIKVAVSNLSDEDSFNAMLFLNADNGVDVEKKKEKISQIMPKETRFFEFEVLSEKTGEFEIGCIIKYSDFNFGGKCSSVQLKFEEEKGNFWFIAISIFLLLGFALAVGILYYVYVYKRN